MDLNKGFMKKYNGIPFSFLFFSYVLWKILVITHYIDFMVCYWGCEVQFANYCSSWFILQ